MLKSQCSKSSCVHRRNISCPSSPFYPTPISLQSPSVNSQGPMSRKTRAHNLGTDAATVQHPHTREFRQPPKYPHLGSRRSDTAPPPPLPTQAAGKAPRWKRLHTMQIALILQTSRISTFQNKEQEVCSQLTLRSWRMAASSWPPEPDLIALNSKFWEVLMTKASLKLWNICNGTGAFAFLRLTFNINVFRPI